MKAENRSTENKRTIRFYDLPEQVCGLKLPGREVYVRLEYVGEHAHGGRDAAKHLALEEAIIPKLIGAVNGLSLNTDELSSICSVLAQHVIRLEQDLFDLLESGHDPMRAEMDAECLDGWRAIVRKLEDEYRRIDAHPPSTRHG